MTNHDKTTAAKTYRELTATQKRVANSMTHWHGEKINPKLSTFRTMRGGISAVVTPFFVVAKEATKKAEAVASSNNEEIDMLALLMGA